MTDATSKLTLSLNAAVQAFRRDAFDEAAALCRDYLAVRPGDGDALHVLGAAELKRGAYASAVDWLARALEIRPGDAAMRTNYGSALMEADRLDDAVAQFRLAIALDARSADAHCNLGNALKRLGRWDESRYAYRAAIGVDPQHTMAHWNESMALLLRGDYANGFIAYEWRFRRPGTPLKPVGKPLWDGRPLPTGVLFLHAEQGIGDTLQFVRFLPAVRQRVKSVVLEVQVPLVPLLSANFPGIRVVARGGPIPVCDAHLPLMSLARVLRTTLETLPGMIPYLAPPPDRLPLWQRHLPKSPARRVGVVWAGGKKHNNDRYRSMPFAALTPLLELPGIAWFSLQVGPDAAAAQAAVPQGRLVDLSPQLHDFADTAACIATLDHVVSVDTSVAHLAGALGKPVDILLPFAPDWRWLVGRADTPWYPSARLFRQPAPGDWTAAVAAVVQALRAANA